ncbi:hypothetical protein Hamer_G005718 [Homarus americanus]|uniref:Uncharacterized protein n=1 Tax=Homarus americanus TaxID=6706 RepID=A0A8J5MN34_HOMAM|nr:hypothetical protein Hamer_G005718 [Homarus americanus]
MMREFGFIYDSSMAAPFSNPPLWPYTMDYKMPHKCMGTRQKCPSRSFPGIWEIVLNQLQAGVPAEDKACSITKSCKLRNRLLRGDRYLHTCFECPDIYPWLKNEFGIYL